METKPNTYWIKQNSLEHCIFPQLRNFCGVASCCGAANSILNKCYSQEQLHQMYGIGGITKLNLAPNAGTQNLDRIVLSGNGMSNWDVIRLFNALLLDNGITPYSTLLTGKDFCRETSNSARRRHLINWLKLNHNQAVIHVVGHYTLFCGYFENGEGKNPYLTVANPSSKQGPISSIPLKELNHLASKDIRYGIILLSSQPIPQHLFSSWTPEMQPPESVKGLRFEKIGTNP